MADIRKVTAYLDDFQRAPENPLSGGGNWLRAAPTIWASNMRIQSVGIVQGNAGDSVMYWTPQTWSGDVEVWARAYAGVDITEGWRLGLFSTLGAGLDGYATRTIVGIGGVNADIRRWDGGGFTTIASDTSSVFPDIDEYLMLRRNGTDVELWFGSTDAQTWTLLLSATDNAYSTNMYAAFGISTDDGGNPGWEGVGGGLRTHRTQDIAIKRFPPNS